MLVNTEKSRTMYDFNTNRETVNILGSVFLVILYILLPEFILSCNGKFSMYLTLYYNIIFYNMLFNEHGLLYHVNVL